MTEKLKLLPCPFCGTDAMIQEGDGRYYAVCNSIECYCALGEAYDRDAMPNHIFYDAETAASAWNKRAAPVSLQDGSKE